MIAFAVLLALIDTFAVSQISFWGLIPLLLSAVVYMFRYEAQVIELLLASAVYGLIVTTFTEADYGMAILSAFVFATAVSIGLLRAVRNSKFRITMRGYDALLISVCFSLSYWLVVSIPSIQTVQIYTLALVAIMSALLNLSIMLVGDLINRKVSR